jgi:hypothetical protein
VIIGAISLIVGVMEAETLTTDILIICDLPPPVTFALAWRWDEYAAVPFASQPVLEALDSIDNPKESAKHEHWGDSDDCVESKRDGSVEYP